MSESSPKKPTNDSITAFDNFLSLLQDGMNHGRDLEPLYAIWSETSEMALRNTCFKSYAVFLQMFSVEYPEPSMPAPRQLRPATSSGLAKSVVEHIQALGDWAQERTEQHQQKHGNKYSWFQSSWLLADFLEEVFPEDINPGRIIADYLRLLLPEEHLTFGKEIVGEFHPPHKIVHSSSLHRIVSEMGEACIEQAGFDGKVKASLQFALRTFLNPNERFELPKGITLDDVIRATVLAAPEGFFLSWERGWWLMERSEGYSTPFTEESIKALLSHGTLKGAHQAGANLGGHKRECITLTVLSDLTLRIELESFELDQELTEMIEELFAVYTCIRRNIFSGVSPFASGTQGFYDFYVSSMPDPFQTMNFTFLLDHGKWEFGHLYLCPESEDPQAIQGEFNDKQCIYIRLFDACLEEGLPELGNAFLSLYLFARGIACQGRFPMGGKLDEAIKTGLSLPGARTLKHTIAAVVDETGRNFSSDVMASLSARYLKQYVPQKAQLYALDGSQEIRTRRASASEEEIMQFFAEKLGEHRWVKLCLESQEHMVSAEVSYRKTSAEFGFGIKDCSGFTIHYCKVLEKELADRLRPFYYSKSYLTFLTDQNTERPKNPTFGWLLTLLKLYSTFTPELQQLLDDSRLQIHHNSELLKDLQEILALRNKAAHQHFDMIQHAQFKKILFQKEVLHRFIDAIA